MSRKLLTVLLTTCWALTGCVVHLTDADSDDSTSGDGDGDGSGDGDGDGSGDGDGDGDGTGDGDGDGDGDGTGDGDGDGDVNPGCEPLCEKIVAAECEDGPTMEGCLLTCKVLTSAPECDTTAQAYFDCVDETDVTCNAAGDPVAEGCGVAYLEAINCAVNENPNPDVVAPCAEYCGNVIGEGCPNNGTEDECNSNCLWSGASGTGCSDEWLGYLDCANTATWTCLLGFAVPEGCGEPYTTYTTCIDEAANG